MNFLCLHRAALASLLVLSACGRSEGPHYPAGHDSVVHAADRTDRASLAGQQVLSAQRTTKAQRIHREKQLYAYGYLAFDERRNQAVAARSGGRIERLFIRYHNQQVKKGQCIAELYSPELNTFQEEYLFLLSSGEDSLALRAREKLGLLGLSEAQLRKLESSAEVATTMKLFSPLNGYVRFASNSQAPAKGDMPATSGMEGMNSTSVSAGKQLSISSEGLLREGAYVEAGQTLFLVNDGLSLVAILSAGFTSEEGFEKGVPIRLYTELQPEPILAHIDFVEPIYQNNQRFTQLRIYLGNANGQLKINSLLKGVIMGEEEVLEVPVSAVYDLGSRKVVWVKTGQYAPGIALFEPREVRVKPGPEQSIFITAGLTADEEIALDAGYMLDSENLLHALR